MTLCLQQIQFYDEEQCLHTQWEQHLFKCGVCVEKQPEDYIMRLVEENKHFGGKTEAHPQLIPEAIAAFHDLNSRRRAAGLDPLVSKVCILFL